MVVSVQILRFAIFIFVMQANICASDFFSFVSKNKAYCLAIAGVIGYVTAQYYNKFYHQVYAEQDTEYAEYGVTINLNPSREFETYAEYGATVKLNSLMERDGEHNNKDTIFK